MNNILKFFMTDNTAILLCNLGSPDDCSEASVRRYLDQFLMDPSVIQLPWIVRRLIVSLLVLPKRPKSSAAAYAKIWTKQGSPLVALSQKLLRSVEKNVKQPAFLAMRYGNPSIESQILAISAISSIEQIYFIPLYPHYADSTVATSVMEAERVIKKHQLDLTLNVKPPFYNDPDYIKSLVEHSSSYIFKQASENETLDRKNIPHLIFSYHGLPESHLRKADPTGNHCLVDKSCCQTQSDAHKTCYRHQVLETTRLFVEAIGLKPSQYSISFQSRLGRAKWLEPSTETTLIDLANRGIKDVVVICPAFTTDCLETLEEIAIQGEQTFKKAGGRSLKLIPCLNDNPYWVKTIAGWCQSK